MKIQSKKTSIRFIKQILKDSKIESKWCNMGSWERDDFRNLLEAAEHYGIKIVSKHDGTIILSMKRSLSNLVSIKLMTSFVGFERDIVFLLKTYALYLGDKTTIATRFGTAKINH